MSRSAVAGLATALLLLVGSPAWAGPAEAPAAAHQASPVSAAAAGSAAPTGTGEFSRAPQPQQSTQEEGPTERQRIAYGVAGLVLIGLVLLSRKYRKKSLLFVDFKKK